MKVLLQKEWFWAALAAVLCFAITYSFIGPYYTDPNNHMYAFGGDALTIYYDVAYHTCYGTGDRLTNMNYPYGELIFLTDAQGALSVILQWINRNLFDVCDCAIGAMHLFATLLLLCSAVVVYYLLRALEVSKTLALVFGVSITILSPQMIRFISHFGLAYPFLIPLTMLWYLRKRKKEKFEIRDLLFLAILIFFAFNNPYTGMGATGLLLVLSLLSLFFKRYRLAGILGIVGVTAFLVPLVYFKLNDSITDRLTQQWGYFYFQASFEGMYTPPGSLMDQFYQKLFHIVHDVQFESWVNLGFATILLLASLIIAKVYFIFRKIELKLNESALLLFGASLIMYAYAAGWFFLPFKEEFVEEKMGFLLMFKAVSRLSWPFYFGASILAVVYFQEITKKAAACCFNILIILIVLANLWEIHDYVVPRFNNTQHDNFFSKAKKDDIREVIKQGKVDMTQYQAMLSLPKQMYWTDLFLSEINFNSQFYGNSISMATGIPLINSMLSRISIGQTAEAIEMVANPLVERSLPGKFPNQKDILLILGADHLPLTLGEQFLTAVADTVLKHPAFTLFRLPLNRINDNKYVTEAKAAPVQPVKANNIYHQNFDNTPSVPHYFGQGAKEYDKGANVLFEGSIAEVTDSVYTFSIWTHIDHLKYGIGDFLITISNDKNERVAEKFMETRRSNEVHDEWIRSETEFPLKKGDKIKVVFNANRKLVVDELLIKPKNQHYKVLGQNSDFLYDNFKIN